MRIRDIVGDIEFERSTKRLSLLKNARNGIERNNKLRIELRVSAGAASNAEGFSRVYG